MTYSKEFLQAVDEIRDNGTMNMYVDDAINKSVSKDELIKEIKLAIKMHRKYDKQPGSSPLHCAIVLSMTRLLGLLC